MAKETDPLVAASDGDAGPQGDSTQPEPLFKRISEMVQLYWHLGFIAFGGPTAHVAILRDHLVRVHNFIEEDIFMELFALGMFFCYYGCCGGGRLWMLVGLDDTS